MSLLDLALWLCPREFRQGYRRDFNGSGSAEALDVAKTGIALRFESLVRDASLACRSLRKTPLFTGVAVVTLALAISVNAVVFGAIEAVLLRPLPFVDGNRLVFLCYEAGEPHCSQQLDSGAIGMYAQHAPSLQGVAAFQFYPLTLSGYGPPQSLLAYLSSENIFQVLGLHPEIGRFFTHGHSSGRVVISDALWRTAFSANPHIVGTSVTLDGTRWLIAGVAPPQTAMPVPGDVAQIAKTIWVPLPSSTFANTGVSNNWAFARLAPGSTIAQASADVRRVTAEVVRRWPAQFSGDAPVGVVPFTAVYHARARMFLLLSLAVVLAVLAIACANVANLLLTRSISRRSELALRSALGATRSTLLRGVAVEAALLAVAGGAIGLFLAWVEVSAVQAFGAASVIPGIDNASIDGRVAAFSMVVVVFVMTVAGLVPAWFSTRDVASGALKSARGSGHPRGSAPLRSALSVVQIALAFAVVVASGLLFRSFASLATANTGMNTSNVYWAAASLHAPRFDLDAARAAFIQRLEARLRALPDVASVAMGRPNPYLPNGGEGDTFRIPDRAVGNPHALLTQITPDYFRLLGVPLVEGRMFTPVDNAASTHVAIVDQHFARRYFPGRNPIGRNILLPPSDQRGIFTPATIVGVVRDITLYGQLDDPRLYVPEAQRPSRLVEIFLKLRAPDPNLRARVSSAVAAVDPLEAVEQFGSLRASVDHSVAPTRAGAALVGALAAIALLLALAGIYSLTSYNVAQRRHEIGVRMAIGARARDIVRNVIAGGLVIAAIGIAFGIILAALATRLISSLLFDTSPFDVVTFAGGIAVIVASVAIACAVPAVRASAIDPSEALRYE